MKTANKDKLTQSILEDDPWKLVKVLSLPAIIGMSINGINSFFDALFVGQMAGQDALAAVSLAMVTIDASISNERPSSVVCAGEFAVLSHQPNRTASTRNAPGRCGR